MIKISKIKLNKIYNKDKDDSLLEFLCNDYKLNEKIEPNDKWKPSDDEELKIKALNESCDLIYKLLSAEEIKISIKKLKEIINKRIIKKNDFPNKPR